MSDIERSVEDYIRAMFQSVGELDSFTTEPEPYTATAAAMTERDLRDAFWLTEHFRCVLYTEFGMVTECVSCGVPRGMRRVDGGLSPE